MTDQETLQLYKDYVISMSSFEGEILSDNEVEEIAVFLRSKIPNLTK